MGFPKLKRLSVEAILKRYNSAITHRELYRDLRESAYEIGMPQRNTFSEKTEGARRMQDIYTSTGMSYVADLRSIFQNKITPPFKKWSEAAYGSMIPPPLRDQFNINAEKLTAAFFDVIDTSNFNSASGESYYDLTAGTMAILLQDTDGSAPVMFDSVPISDVALLNGAFGIVSDVFRDYQLTERQLLQTWPDAKTSVISKLSQNDSERKISLLEATYDAPNGGKFYDILLKDTNERIVERELNYNPWLTPRIGRLPGEIYGRGPLISAAPDLHMLNQASELSIRHMQLSAYGIYTVADNDILNVDNLELNPGVIIPVSRNGGPNGPSLAPLPIAGDVNLQQISMQQLKQDAREIMRIPRLPSDVGPVRSATEIMARLREIRETTSPFLGSLSFEYIQPLWQSVLTILQNKKIISLPPELKKVDNRFLKIKILSPIAKEQALEDVENFVHSMELTKNFGGEQLLQLGFKMEDFPEWVGKEMGVPSSLIRTEEERAQLMQMAQQAQQQQAQQEAPQ